MADTASRKPAPDAAGGRPPAGLRLETVRRMLAEHGFVSVTAIAKDLGVSDMTVRRDLARLEEMDLAVRTHGGALAPGKQGMSFDADEPAFDARARKGAAAKGAIAAEAAALPRPFQTVGIDAGTTTLELARRLTGGSDLKIFTNNLRAAMVLSESLHQVYVPGGQIRPGEYSVHGSIGIDQLRQFWLDIAFIGVSGLTEDGFYDYSLEETEMKRVFMERASTVVILCDSNKFERLSLVRVSELGAATLLVTDAPPPPAIAAALDGAGCRVVVAGPLQPDI